MLMRDLYAHIISILHGATNADTDKYRIVDTEEKREAFTNALRDGRQHGEYCCFFARPDERLYELFKRKNVSLWSRYLNKQKDVYNTSYKGVPSDK